MPRPYIHYVKLMCSLYHALVLYPKLSHPEVIPIYVYALFIPRLITLLLSFLVPYPEYTQGFPMQLFLQFIQYLLALGFQLDRFL